MQVFENVAAKKIGVPRLSVLVPYYKDDPKDLLNALAQSKGIEVLLYDDGTGDEAINEALRVVAKKAGVAVRLFFAKTNKGRSTARNILTQECKGKVGVIFGCGYVAANGNIYY